MKLSISSAMNNNAIRQEVTERDLCHRVLECISFVDGSFSPKRAIDDLSKVGTENTSCNLANQHVVWLISKLNFPLKIPELIRFLSLILQQRNFYPFSFGYTRVGGGEVFWDGIS